MHLSPDTINVLKNFSAINQSIVIQPGKLISTRSANMTVVAVAEIDDEFDQLLAIYDLPQFLNVFGMFQAPVLDLSGGRKASIRDGKTVVNYTFAEPSLLSPAPKGVGDIVPLTQFELSSTILQQLLKAANVMALPDVIVRADGKSIYIGAIDSESPSSNKYEVEVGETSEIFTAFVKIESFKQLSRDYIVRVTPRILAFESVQNNGQTVKLSYWIGLEQKSKF